MSPMMSQGHGLINSSLVCRLSREQAQENNPKKGRFLFCFFSLNGKVLNLQKVINTVPASAMHRAQTGR